MFMKESKCDFDATSTSTYFGICHYVIEKKNTNTICVNELNFIFIEWT